MTRIHRLLALSALSLLPLGLLAACTDPDDQPDGGTTPVNTTVEFQDIFIPERLIEIPVLPEGTQVTNEIHVHNAGDSALALDEVSLNYQSDANWELVAESVPAAVAPHQHAVVEVLYTAAAEVDTFAALDFFSDDPDEAELTVAFIGHQASGGPVATLSQQIIDWGFQFRGEEKRRALEIRNDGDEPLQVLSVEMIQSATQPAFTLTCPGRPLDSCDWGTEQLPLLLDDPIFPGSGALIEIAFIPLNLQSVSAQLKIQTTDPLRPEFTIYLLGNGDSALNCTVPTIQVTSPAEATFYHAWGDLTVSARVHDQEQPAGSLYVEMFLGDLLIEDEFPDENGFLTFVIDIDEHVPPLPSGLQPFTLRVTDGCRLTGFATFVAAIDFPLSSTDVDGDGFDPNQGDCNDNNPDIFPQNAEVLDALDNNCNSLIDEDTAVWDDDCDGYCESPPCNGQGPAPSPATSCAGLASDAALSFDCNDSVADLDGDGTPDGTSIFPEATESLNFIDDNCNGITDEGTTFYDDDQDGQTEAVGDCNDADADTFEGATEWCDQVDNDCDGDIDDSCIDEAAPPRVIGGVICDHFQVELGERVHCEVLVVSHDDNLTYEWLSDMDGTFDEPATGPQVFWNAPPDDEDHEGFIGDFPTIMVTVTDSLGQPAYGFGNVLLTEMIKTSFSSVAPQSDDCSAAGRTSASGWSLAVIAAALGLRRRRASRTA